MSIHKRILVTGGAGFLGSHLCDRIIDGAIKLSASIIFTQEPAKMFNI